MEGLLGIHLNDVTGQEMGGFLALKSILQTSVRDEAMSSWKKTNVNAYLDIKPGAFPASADGGGIERGLDNIMATYVAATAKVGEVTMMTSLSDEEREGDFSSPTLDELNRNLRVRCESIWQT